MPYITVFDQMFLATQKKYGYQLSLNEKIIRKGIEITIPIKQST
tara:strand:- start:409 stop:540 length:132 start_codon:yes stop_codon:yes gene_type:complete